MYELRGCKVPLIDGRISAPQSTSNKWVYINQALLSDESWVIGVCTLLALQPKLLQQRAALVPCSFGLAGPALFLLPWLGKRASSKTPWSGQQKARHPDSIIPQNPAPESSPLDSTAMAPCPRPSLKLSDSSCQSKQIDYFILVTNPGSDCRGAYFNYKSQF